MLECGWREALVLQRDDGLVALAKRSHSSQSTLQIRQIADRTVAVNRVAVFREVPGATLAGNGCLLRLHRNARRGREGTAGKGKRQKQQSYSFHGLPRPGS